MRNTTFFAIAAICGALAISSSATAGTITANFRASNTGPFPSLQQDNDFSYEYLAVDNNGNGIIDIGDSIRGIASFESIGRQGGSQPTTRLATGQGGQVTEFTAIFATQVVDKAFAGTINGVDQYSFVMGPDAAFNALYGNTAGTMVAMFDDPGKDFDPNAPLSGAGNVFELASNGTRVLDIGFTGALPTIDDPINGLGEGWTANGTDDTNNLPSIGGPGVGSYFASLNALFQGGGYENFVIGFTQVSLSNQHLVQFSANGQIFASPSTTLTIGDSADVFWDIEQVVPEPSTFAIWGIGAVGVAVIGRRRRKA